MKFKLFALLLCVGTYAQAADNDAATVIETKPVITLGIAQPDGGRWCHVKDQEDPPPDCVPGE